MSNTVSLAACASVHRRECLGPSKSFNRVPVPIIRRTFVTPDAPSIGISVGIVDAADDNAFFRRA